MLNFSEIMILTMSRTLVRIRQKYCSFAKFRSFEKISKMKLISNCRETRLIIELVIEKMKADSERHISY